MFLRSLLLLALMSSSSLAEQRPVYKDASLDGVYKRWDEITKAYTPGLSVMQPQKLHFFSKYVSAPAPCNNDMLKMIFTTLGVAELLNNVSVTHCVKFSSDAGRVVTAFIQDSIVPGMNSDAKVGDKIEIYADLLAYEVRNPRTQNTPVMLVNRFEPTVAPPAPGNEAHRVTGFVTPGSR